MNKSAQNLDINQATGTATKKNVSARIFALLFAAITLAVAFLVSVKIPFEAAHKEMQLFNAVKDVLSSSYKAFGLPVLVNAFNYPTRFAGLALYGFAGFLAISVILAIFTLFCRKKAPGMLRAVVFFFTAGWASNAIAVFAFTYYQTQTNLLDLYSIALAIFGAFVYFILAVTKNGKKAWLNQFNVLLSIGAYAAILLAMLRYTADFKTGLESGLKGYVSFKIVLYVLCPLAMLNALICSIRLQAKKGIAFDVVRYVVQFLVSLAVCYIAMMSKGAKAFLYFAIAAAGVSFLQIIIGSIQNNRKEGKKKKVKAPKEKKAKEPKAAEVAPVQEIAPVQEPIPAIPAPVPAPAMAVAPVQPVQPAQPTQPAQAVVEIPSEYVVEEYAEALPYDGGPVEGVALAQEVNPTFTSMPVRPVETAGYDFYNSKSFDPFIAVLDNQERNQFTEIFILKYKGEMPEIPDYTVGGDNKEFFRKLFIYLGQYRDRIPDGLLAKIYQFTVKMK